jgi:pyrroloquinoline quinone biosynthesis protein B
LREGSPLAIYGTRDVLDSLRDHDALCRTLERYPEQTRWSTISIGRAESLVAVDGQPTGLVIEAVPVAGKIPPHLEGLVDEGPGQNVALLIRAEKSGRTLGYASSVACDSWGVQRILSESDLVVFDGTFWSSEELVALGASHRRAEDMAHWPLSGSSGSLELLRRQYPERCVLTHINNTNPILRDGPERRAVLSAGIRIAQDGLDVIP